MTRYITICIMGDVVTSSYVYVAKEEAMEELLKTYERNHVNNKKVEVSNVIKTEDSIAFDERFVDDDVTWRVEYRVIPFTL